MHLLIDGYMQEDAVAVDDVAKWLVQYPKTIDMNVIAGPIVRKVDDMLTGLVVIAESHISVHVDRKTRATHIDVFSCKPFDNRRVEADVIDMFKLRQASSRVFVREGDFLADRDSAMEHLAWGAERLTDWTGLEF